MAAVPATGDPIRDDAQPIPLECVLCPRNPRFSDVSHLLTHVSSKSHLHNKFNSEFRAKSEPAIRDKLRRYEAWYSANGIETLLSERLAAKDQKKGGGGRRGRAGVAGVSALTEANLACPGSLADSCTRNRLELFLGAPNRSSKSLKMTHTPTLLFSSR